MAHNHSHHHHHHESKNIAVAFFLNLIFAIIEIIGGIITNSVSILSDALHDAGDALSLGLAWFLEKYSGKKSDQKYAYGYRRYAVLGAIINSIILFVGSIFIIYEGVQRFANPESVDAKGMIGFALLGVLFNGIAFWRLSKNEGINSKAVALHLVEDVLGWVAVLIGSIIMYFFEVPWLDPLLSIFIACYILYNVFRNLNTSIQIIMQGTPADLKMNAIQSALLDHHEIEDVHDIRAWSMDGSFNIMTIHVVLKGDVTWDNQKTIKSYIKSKMIEFDVHHVTIEFETKEEHCEVVNHKN